MTAHQLLTPGPVPVPNAIVAAMAAPMLYHRSPPFQALMDEVRQGLRYVFQTTQEVLVFAASGSGGMESALVNTLCAGDTIIVVKGGKFGQRWEKLATAYGVRVVPVDVPWGEAVDPAAVARALAEHPHARAVCVQASETSTGAVHPIEALAALTRQTPETLLVVDAITGLGIFDLPMDRWGIDVMIAGSQKGFMLPPGLVMVAASERAWQAQKRATLPRFYFDWAREKAALDSERTPAYTPAITLVMGLGEVLRGIRSEGLPALFERHHLMASAVRAGSQAMGLELFSSAPSDSVTALRVPPGVDGSKLVRHLRDRYQVILAGGQDHLKGKIIRIGHMGSVNRDYVVQALSVLELALADLGHEVTPGAGVSAALTVLRG